MLFPPQLIFCSGCGKPYKAQFNSGWVAPGAKARVCGKECHDKVENAYYRAVLGKPDPQTDDLFWGSLPYEADAVKCWISSWVIRDKKMDFLAYIDCREDGKWAVAEGVELFEYANLDEAKRHLERVLDKKNPTWRALAMQAHEWKDRE